MARRIVQFFGGVLSLGAGTELDCIHPVRYRFSEDCDAWSANQIAKAAARPITAADLLRAG